MRRHSTETFIVEKSHDILSSGCHCTLYSNTRVLYIVIPVHIYMAIPLYIYIVIPFCIYIVIPLHIFIVILLYIYIVITLYIYIVILLHMYIVIPYSKSLIFSWISQPEFLAAVAM